MSWRMLTPPTGFTSDKKVPSGALGSLWDLEKSEGECFQGGGCTDTRHMFYMWKCGEVKLFCTHPPEDEQKTTLVHLRPNDSHNGQITESHLII